MLGGYYELVTDAFVPLAWRRRLEAAGHADDIRKARLVAALSGLASVLVLGMYFVGVARGGADATLVVELLSGLYYAAIPPLVRLGRRASFAALLFIAPVFVIFPLRASTMGGIHAGIVFWFALVPVASGALLSRRAATLATLLALAESAWLVSLGLRGGSGGAVAATVVKGLSVGCVLLLLLLMTLFYEDERAKREAMIRAQGDRLRGAAQLAALGRAVLGVASEVRAPTEQLLDLAEQLRLPESSEAAAREELARLIEASAQRIAGTVEELGALHDA